MTVDDLFRELYPIVELGVGAFEKRRPLPGRIALRVEDERGEGWEWIRTDAGRPKTRIRRLESRKR